MREGEKKRGLGERSSFLILRMPLVSFVHRGAGEKKHTARICRIKGLRLVSPSDVHQATDQETLSTHVFSQSLIFTVTPPQSATLLSFSS